MRYRCEVGGSSGSGGGSDESGGRDGGGRNDEGGSCYRSAGPARKCMMSREEVLVTPQRHCVRWRRRRLPGAWWRVSAAAKLTRLKDPTTTSLPADRCGRPLRVHGVVGVHVLRGFA